MGGDLDEQKEKGKKIFDFNPHLRMGGDMEVRNDTT